MSSVGTSTLELVSLSGIFLLSSWLPGSLAALGPLLTLFCLLSLRFVSLACSGFFLCWLGLDFCVYPDQALVPKRIHHHVYPEQVALS